MASLKRVLALCTAASLCTTASLGLSGCAQPLASHQGVYTQPIGDAPVISNDTPYSKALVCLANYARLYKVKAPRLAVGRIADYTGKAEDNGGRLITQGASLMAISALAKAGVPLVERYDTSVSELELKYANNKLIADAPPPAPGPRVCMSDDPLGTTGPTGGYIPAYNNVDQNNGQTRSDPSRWNSARDPGVNPPGSRY